MRTLAALVLLVGMAHAHPRADSVDVKSYQVRLRPDFEARSLVASNTIELTSRGGPLRTLHFPLGALTVDRVMSRGRPLVHTVENSQLTVILDRELGRGESVTLTIDYHGSPRRGLVWGADSLRTTFFTCAWLLCDQDSPEDKASFGLEIDVPPDLEVVGNGVREAKVPLDGGRILHRWRQSRAYSSYLFGFAVGRFDRAVAPDAPRLEVMSERGAANQTAATLRSLDLARKFFEDKSGLSLPDGRYTQVIVDGEDAQEAASFSIVGTAQMSAEDDWVLAHELAHQWWGNLVTCAGWRDFWLNEGMVVFMTAAYKEQRWGRAAYERELERARAKRQKAVDAGFDVPLAYGGAYPSLRIKRAIVYSKGALFLHALRENLGEQRFWSGIREYTRRFAGATVESRDFQAALEAASGVDLSELFAEWVFGRRSQQNLCVVRGAMP